VGQEWELEFNLPSASDPQRPRVQVIRKEPRGIGVKFVALTVEARENIRRYTGVGAKEAMAS